MSPLDDLGLKGGTLAKGRRLATQIRTLLDDKRGICFDFFTGGISGFSTTQKRGITPFSAFLGPTRWTRHHSSSYSSNSRRVSPTQICSSSCSVVVKADSTITKRGSFVAVTFANLGAMLAMVRGEIAGEGMDLSYTGGGVIWREGGAAEIVIPGGAGFCSCEAT